MANESMKVILVVAALMFAVRPAAAQTSAPEPIATPGSGWVGITYSGTGEADREGNIAFVEYPVVVSVDPGSPAAKAGIVAGDTITAFNDRDLRKYALPVRSMIQAGKIFVLKSRRGNGDRTVRIVVAERPDNRPERLQISMMRSSEFRPARMTLTPVGPPAPVNAIVRVAVPGIGNMMGSASVAIAGAEVRRLTADIAEALGVKPQGLFVVNVADASPAQESGLYGGDVILRAAKTSLSTPGDLIRVMRDATDKDVRLEIIRKRKAQTVLLKW